MDEDQAQRIAEALGGETWQSGGDMWLVLFRRSDGSVVAMSDESVVEYASEEDLIDGEGGTAIHLR